MEIFRISTGSGTSFEDITEQVRAAVKKTGVREGICCVYVPHTTAGVMVNENADPSVCRDVIMELGKIVPHSDGYQHSEGNSAAHIKSALLGESVSVPVCDGDLCLGTWQGIFFCEFDGPRRRNVNVVVR